MGKGLSFLLLPSGALQRTANIRTAAAASVPTRSRIAATRLLSSGAMKLQSSDPASRNPSAACSKVVDMNKARRSDVDPLGPPIQIVSDGFFGRRPEGSREGPRGSTAPSARDGAATRVCDGMVLRENLRRACLALGNTAAHAGNLLRWPSAALLRGLTALVMGGLPPYSANPDLAHAAVAACIADDAALDEAHPPTTTGQGGH